jgi:hypothetical protein
MLDWAVAKGDLSTKPTLSEIVAQHKEHT